MWIRHLLYKQQSSRSILVCYRAKQARLQAHHITCYLGSGSNIVSSKSHVHWKGARAIIIAETAYSNHIRSLRILQRPMNRSRPFTGGRSSLKRQIAWAAMWPNDAKWGCNGHGRFTKLDQYVDFLHLMGPYMLVTWVRIILCRDRKGWMKNKNCIESCWDLNNYPTTQLGVWPCVIHGLNGLTFGLVAGTPKPQVVNSFTLWHEETIT